MFELKPISADAIPRALAKAERYRLLNEPEEAESICRDILGTNAEHQQALVMLLLALTDQFGARSGGGVQAAREVLRQLGDPYEQAYYAGIIDERWGKIQLETGTPGHVGYDWIRDAMDWYEKARDLSAPGNEDAILRWNACARLLNQARHLATAHDEIRLDTSSGDEPPPR